MTKRFWGILMTVLLLSCIFTVVIASPNSSKVVTYGDTITLYFDDREWTLGADNAKTNIFYEYVTDGQTVYNWRELITLQIYKGLQEKATADVFAKDFISGLYSVCGDKLTVSVIRNNPYDYMIEWKVNGHPKIDDQHEIDRYIIGKESLIIVHYVAKTASLSPNNRTRWIEIMDKATIR